MVSEPAVAVRTVSGVIAVDDAGDVLLVHRADDRSWGLPGGGAEAGETWRGAAARECLEETGWSVQLLSVFGVYSDPETQTQTYPDGSRVQLFGVVFLAACEEHVGGRDAEALRVRFFPATALPDRLFGPDRPVLMDYVAGRRQPVISSSLDRGGA